MYNILLLLWRTGYIEKEIHTVRKNRKKKTRLYDDSLFDSRVQRNDKELRCIRVENVIVVYYSGLALRSRRRRI